MAKLSVNINKIATLRNSRGKNNPDVLKTAQDCERFGAEGITVHPRPDERHIKYHDVVSLSEVLTKELNIEGYPDQRYMSLIKKAKTTQATLVPDAPDAITSNAGWDTIQHEKFLKDVVEELQSEGIRTSIFIEPDVRMVEGASNIGADRIELYTGHYANQYHQNKKAAIVNYITASQAATKLGLGINAGHDLDLHNLNYIYQNISALAEVSIGHALICDALYLGLENAIQMYKRQLNSFA